jgi:mannose-6-phosphate isomerase-like protein (cupin superfamily)
MKRKSKSILSGETAKKFHGLEVFALSPEGRGPFSALKIRVAPNTDLPCIYHAKMWEFFYVLKGRGYGRVGKKRVSFKKDSRVFIPPKVPHDFHTGNEGLEALVIFSPRFDKDKPDVLPASSLRIPK